MSRLIVKNLPQQTTEKTLRDLFGKKGTVTDCSLKYKDGMFRRFAFIGYSSEEEAQAAQKYYDKTFVNTSRIFVEIAVDLGHAKPKPWSKYSKVEEPPQENAKEKKVERKKKKKEENDAALLGELHKDPEFKEYMAAYTPKNRKTWGNDSAVDNDNTAIDDDSSDDGADEEEQDDKKDAEKKDDEKSDDDNDKKDIEEKTKKISDLDFLKSKMADAALVSSDDDEEDGDKSTDVKASLKKEKKEKKSEKDETLKTSPKKKKEKGEEKEETPRQKFCLKMKGLPTTIRENAVREFFKPLKVKLRLPMNKQKQSIGVAFVECRSEKDLEAALGKNKSFIGKKKVFLKRIFEEIPTAPEVKEKPRPWELKAEKEEEEEESIAESGRLFVRNLAYQCTEDTLEPLFAKFGPVTDFDLPVDPFTKKIKGFAHVTFMMPEHAVKAFAELDGKAFMGRMLHILPGKDREEKYTSAEKSSYKKQKDEKTKALAKSSHNWNTLFLSSNAVATAMATKYQTDKSHILDDSGKGSLGVRMALGETQLVQETRQFLLENGVALDSFSQADGERSKTVILAKDLPAETQADELREVFSKYGTVSKVVLPPHGSSAIIEFQEPSEAKRGFTKLAYRRFKYLPLYLEWAPMAVFNKDSADTKEEDDKDEQMPETEEKEEPTPNEETSKKQEDSGVESESGEESVPGSTVFVKNLNFDTQEDALKELFSRAGDVRRVTVAKKKDMKHPGKFLSMGYGFVEYKKATSAMQSLKTLQKAELDGHTLELKISNRETLQPKSGRKKQSSSQQGSTKILIRNIPFQCNKKEVEELFKVFGELKYVRVPKKSSGPGIQGFGFVDFLTKQDAKRAFDALCHSTYFVM
ncbi:probable RNA-binding protein 19 isoform X2 [Littorina saxatilis]|uniref:probable RNA-binding protein 19 isoform X2 n=1 Tax=Littorina saxatilis TaxID=31220 RepID=UPI0038B67BD0